MPLVDAQGRPLLRSGLTLADLINEGPPEQQQEKASQVHNGPELKRILSLPRRPAPAASNDADELARFLTSRLARHADPYPCGRQYGPKNTGYMRPIQAAALRELYTYGGVFGPIRAGYGKTLLAYLAPCVVGARRPLYVAPASLEQDVRREFARLSQHWLGPKPEAYEFVSYQTLGVESAGVKMNKSGTVLRAALLDRINPDLIVFDEAHFLKNAKAAVTRRVRRFLEEHPNIRVVVMSGTMARRSLKDYAHLAAWSLRRMSPLPLQYTDVEAWADALDEKDSWGPRTDVGALIQFCNTAEQREVTSGDAERARDACRIALSRHVKETPGVVVTNDGPLGIPISIEPLFAGDVGVAPDPLVERVFKELREVWELPDHEPIADGLGMARHTRTIGLGFWGRWNPRPPDEWLLARREWCSWVRDVLKHNRRGLDSEKQVKDAVLDGMLKDLGRLAAWEGVAAEFDPEASREVVWVSDEVIQVAGAWASKHPGIIWVQDIELGQRLSKELRIAYYAEGGLDARGKFILDHPHGKPMIASAAANRMGRNLQKGWSENLLLTVPEEQMLARTHRDGQLADKVTFWQYLGCYEHAASFDRAVRLARYQEQQWGQSMRLCYAECSVPTAAEVTSRPGARWNRDLGAD